uniref:Reverse transcriptase domain-containing protein n=1 Tax=Tanacetum cinerariifolium TaxID=118510 RepID=A0A6L2K7I0_TANCI|nr:reverse transcriptase domain-containing protein [Tanacetum cinerariifolium]
MMLLSVCKKIGLPELISTRMTLKLANRAICTLAGIARDVFVPVGKFTFPADFVIVDYESDHRVPLILGRPFLRTARALIDVHGEEMILRDVRMFLKNCVQEIIKVAIPLSLLKDDVLTLIVCSRNFSHLLSPLRIATLSWRSPILLSPIQIFLCPNSRLLSFIQKRRIVEVPLLMLITLSPKFETFYFDIEEKNSSSTTIHADISLSDLECFKFDFKPDPCELTSIVDFGIRKNVPSATNVNLLPEEDHSPLFAYVVWIFLSFLTYPLIPLYLFSFGNKDTIFDPGIANYHFSSLLPDVSYRCETFMKFNVYPKLLNESPMEILSSSCSPLEQ